MFLSSMVGFIYGVKYFNKISKLKFFVLLLSLSIIDTVSYLVISVILKKTNIFLEISPIIQSFYLVTEFSIFSIFFMRIIKNKYLQFFLKFILISFLIIDIILIINGINAIEKYFTIFFITEFLIVNIFCVIILIKNLYDQLQIEPWDLKALNGIFIFINFTAPYYFISQYLNINNQNLIYSLNSINDIGYSILFIYLFNSFRCLKQK